MTHCFFSGVDLEAVLQTRLQRLLVLLPQFSDTGMGFWDLVWNHAKQGGFSFWFPFCHYLDVGGSSIQHTHVEGSEGGWVWGGGGRGVKLK